MDPTQDDNHILLTWQWKAPEFTTDFDIYISEQYKSLPQNEFADIRIENDHVSGSTTLVLLFHDWFSFHSFSASRSSESMYHASTPSPGQTWSPKSEIIFSICAVFQLLSQQTVGFLNSCTREMDQMVRQATRPRQPRNSTG